MLLLSCQPLSRLLDRCSSCGDKTIRVWNTATGQHLATYKVHTDMVSDLAWSPDSRFLATANPDATAHIWDTIRGELLLVYGGHSASVRSVAWSPDRSEEHTSELQSRFVLVCRLLLE